MPSLGSRSVVLPDGSVEAGTVEIEGERIAGFVAGSADGLPDTIVAPGFIDLQVNGHEDVDVSVADGPGWDRLDELLLAQGVTAWCPTLVSAPLASYGAALERIAAATGRKRGPAILGAHLEGPFLGGLPGAHDPRWLLALDGAWLSDLPETVRIVTLAPELHGAVQAIGALKQRGVVASLGHSTATYDVAREAAAAGARLVTHLFNAMAPLHHRDPGLVGAALTDPRLTPTLIADLVHVHPAVVTAAFRARRPLGSDPGIALVTDAVAWRAGHVAGVRLTREGTDVPRRPDGTMAGSTLTMDRAVANVVAAGIPVADAVAAASQVPARVLGLAQRGRIEAGARADLVVLSPDLGVRQTWLGGAVAWEE